MELVRLNEVAWRISVNDLHNLLSKQPVTLRFLYCDETYWGENALQWESVRTTRKKFRRLLERGEILMPKRTEAYPGDETEREAIKSRRRRVAPKTGAAALSELISLEDRKALHDQLDELLDTTQLEPNQLRLKGVNKWEGYIKNSDGEAEKIPLYSMKLEADPAAMEPKWDIEVSKLEYNIKPAKYERKESLDGFKTAVVFGDPHFAFRKYPDGTLDPIHDPSALEIALQLIRELRPEHVISTGDMLDYAELSRFEKQPEFQGTMNATLRAAGEFLARIRATVPDAQFDILEGNHCRRLHKSIVTNFADAYGWKKGGDESLYPSLSVPELMNYEQLGINYIAGYPANRLFLNSELQVKHGNVVKSRDSTAKAVTGDERISSIYGHIHRVEQHGRTMQTADGPKRIHAFSSGCLCRIDGAVPSTHSSTDVQGKPLENYENWEQGLLVVHYHEDGRYHVEPISIDLNHQAHYRGKLYGVKKEDV